MDCPKKQSKNKKNTLNQPTPKPFKTTNQVKKKELLAKGKSMNTTPS